MSVSLAPLLRGSVTQSSGADNATATATVAAIAATQHLILGIEAHYDAQVTARKTVTVKHGSTTFITFRWDFTNDTFVFAFPVALKGGSNEAVSVELEASGNGGDSGYVSLWVAAK